MHIMHEFSYERPTSLDEALALLARHEGKASPLAGGTDLLVYLKQRSILQLTEGAGSSAAKWPAARRVPPMLRPEVVVSLRDIPDLKGVSSTPSRVEIGPLTTMSELASHGGMPNALLALRDAAAIMGSPLIRNRATVGGNVINARPAADTAVAVLALGGELELASASGRRKVAAASFFTGPGTSVRRPDELLVGISFQVAERQGSAYFRLGVRQQLEIALTCAAARLRLDGAGKVHEAQIALGAVGPTPILATGAAAALVGRTPSEETFAEAARIARSECRPIDDFRGSAAYRLEVVPVLVRRALELSTERARVPGGGA